LSAPRRQPTPTKKKQARLDAIAEGKVAQEQFDKAFEETSKKFYVDLQETFNNTIESVSALGQCATRSSAMSAPRSAR